VSVVYAEIILAPTYHGQQPMWRYLAFFDRHGYRLVDLFNPKHSEGVLIQVDALFAAPAVLQHHSLRGRAERVQQ
jgi:hypothetical protein